MLYLFCVSDNLNHGEVTCQHLKECVKNVIFLEYQKSWRHSRNLQHR